MDWTLAIDRQREALLRMVAALLVMAGGGEVLSRFERSAVFRVLRPAEAAFRRLVVIVMERTEEGAQPVRAPVIRPVVVKIARGDGARIPAFALFDPRKPIVVGTARRPVRHEPRIRGFDWDEPVYAPKPVPLPDDPVSAARMMRRLQALQLALEDVPKQARRLARMQTKRESGRAETGKYIRPMRPGRPPGYRARTVHPVDEVLKNCHQLALYAIDLKVNSQSDPPDTG